MPQQGYTYKGMVKDLAKSKRTPEYYYDAKNIRILSSDEETSFAVTTEKGNELVYSILNYDGFAANILGDCVLGEYLILFIYYSPKKHSIIRINTTTEEITEFYKGINLNFQLNTYFSTEVFYENENILKIYWADGINPLRYMNILNPPTNETLLDACPSFIVSSPELESISYGGIHTSGMIQYCYNLILKNGAQTRVSPRTELIPLKKQVGGGDVNELVGQINHIKIDDVDVKFDIIRLYSVKYTSYNQSPIVSLVAEESIGKPIDTNQVKTTVRFTDDGNVIYNISEKELLFLGGENIVPAHISSKFNYLILGDIKENYFDITTEQYDTRAYRFQKNSSITEIKNKDADYQEIAWNTNLSAFTYKDTDTLIGATHDCINDQLNISTTSTTTSIIEPSGSVDKTFFGYTSFTIDGVDHSGILFDSYETIGDCYVKVYLHVNDSLEIHTSELLRNYSITDIAQYTSDTINSGYGTLYPSGYSITPGVETRSNYGEYGVIFYDFYDDQHNPAVLGYQTRVEVYKTVITTVTSFNDNVDQIYAYTRNTGIFGATGNNIELSIVQASSTDTSNLLKSRETYRFAIEFYNNRGQVTPPKWINDLYIPDGNLDANKINKLKVELFNTDVLLGLGVVGWNLLRVERTDADKTIITQGIINPSIYQDYTVTVPSDTTTVGSRLANESALLADSTKDPMSVSYTKLPSPFMRNVDDLKDALVTTLDRTDPPWPISIFLKTAFVGSSAQPRIKGIQNRAILSSPALTDDKKHLNFPFPEFFKNYRENELTSQETYQFTKLFQLYSPELVFLNPIFGNELKYSVVGKLDNTLDSCGVWGKQIAVADAEYVIRGDLPLSSDDDVIVNVTKKDILNDIRLNKHFHLFNTSEARTDSETYSSLHKTGLIGPVGGRSPRQNLYQYYRKYSLDSNYNNTYIKKDISGNPLIIGKGEGGKVYNAPSLPNVETTYTFNNHLFTIIADRNTIEPKEAEAPIISVNSIGANCLNIVDGTIVNNVATPLTLEDILTSYNITGDSTGLVEVSRVLVNQYGGNTYESRSRNRYIRIGKYQSLLPGENSNVQTITKAGDVFVNIFKFLRIIPNIAQVENTRYTAMCEIVEFPVESSINNECRNDYSLNSWDSNWFPSFDEYHNYNRVYSQEPISNVNTANPFTFEEVKHSSVRLLSTKVKTPGELIDSWTDILINEELNLNGQYGKLNKLIRNNDNLFFFQDNAFGIVLVQPRVAIQASDGIGVELGTGQILYNYQYISTASGSTNPKCIFNSPNFVYYIDVTNRTLNRTNGQPPEGLSDNAGLHVYMYNNILPAYEKTQYLSVVGIFDNLNDEAYFTTPGFTIVFNESLNNFTSFYDFIPTMYIKVPGKIFSSNDNNTIWQHLVGDYASFYGTVYDSTVTLFCNPQQFGGLKTRFDNLEFNAEVRDNDIDIFLEEGNNHALPIEKVEVTTDYQHSLDTTLVWGNNIKRRFRNWAIILPRHYDTNLSRVTLDRMRGEWAYIKLTINNDNNYKKVLHDVILSYA